MLQRMENGAIVVDDLKAATTFFVELGLELEGEAPVEGPWVDGIVGLDNVRVDVAMVRTPDGHGRRHVGSFSLLIVWLITLRDDDVRMGQR